jgi:hypothetical protein
MAKCDICKEEREGLRKCKDCDTIFCHWCMVGKDFKPGGQVIEVHAVCPKCKRNNIIEIT